jgi:uncharacterized protein DUF6328
MPVEPGESDAHRLNRNYDDLLQELRVSQNGTQILFAFLLTVPFSKGFSGVTNFEQAVYFAALLLAALSAAMLIAPAVMHRILFRSHHMDALVRAASKVALGGQALLAVAVALSVFLVTDYLYGHALAVVMALVVLAWTSVWFFVLPLYIRKAGHPDRERASST